MRYRISLIIPIWVIFKLYMPRKLWMSSFQDPNLAWFGAIVVKIWCSEGRWRSIEKLCDVFSLKNLIFQSIADIVDLFLWKIAKTLVFKMVQPAHSSSCLINTIYCSKSSQKLPVFPFFLNKKSEDFIMVFGILVISHPF